MKCVHHTVEPADTANKTRQRLNSPFGTARSATTMVAPQPNTHTAAANNTKPASWRTVRQSIIVNIGFPAAFDVGANPSSWKLARTAQAVRREGYPAMGRWGIAWPCIDGWHEIYIIDLCWMVRMWNAIRLIGTGLAWSRATTTALRRAADERDGAAIGGLAPPPATYEHWSSHRAHGGRGVSRTRWWRPRCRAADWASLWGRGHYCD